MDGGVPFLDVLKLDVSSQRREFVPFTSDTTSTDGSGYSVDYLPVPRRKILAHGLYILLTIDQELDMNSSVRGNYGRTHFAVALADKTPGSEIDENDDQRAFGIA
jgi:hypothetical protein